MRAFPKTVFAILVAALPFALMGATLDVSRVSVPAGAAAIYNPGNSDLGGFLIIVQQDGQAWAIDSAGRSATKLGTSATQTFFTDLAAAGPLGRLPTNGCPALWPSAPSTSAATAIAVYWNGQRSPDLNCVADARAARLLADAAAIQRSLYVQAYHTRSTQNLGGGIYVNAPPTTYVQLQSYAPSGYVDVTNVGINFGGNFDAGSFPTNGRFDMSSFNVGGHFYNTPFASDGRFSNGVNGLAGARFSNGGQFSNGGRFDDSTSFAGRSGLYAGSLPLSNPLHSLGGTGIGSSNPTGASPYSAGPYSGAP